MTNSYENKGVTEATELASQLSDGANIKFIDATFVMPGAPVNAKDVFKAKRIGDTAFFDINEIADPTSDMAHMIPTPEDFERAVSALGISNDDFVVVYDQTGIAMAAARAWWMFRLFGHDKVTVLNGGLPYWEATGHAVNTAPHVAPAAGTFKARFRPELVKNLQDMQKAVSDAGTKILDARAAERYHGRVPEPRPDLRPGHIPGSRNLPFMTLIGPDGRLKDRDALCALLGDCSDGPHIASCGSGVTACVLALGFYHAHSHEIPVYDGSWTEWGRTDRDTEVAVSD